MSKGRKPRKRAMGQRTLKYKPGGLARDLTYAPEWKEIEEVCTRAAASLVSARRYHRAAELLEIAERAKMRQPPIEEKKG
jgi:hypothetical protein